jgi:hypothetical protein
VLVIAGAALADAPKRGIEGQVFFTRPIHCGGARPRDGEKLSDRAPAGKRVLLFRPGDTNDARKKTTEVTADADGRFQVDLPDGVYCVVDAAAKRAPAKAGQYQDQGCVDAYFAKCDAVVTAPASVTVELYGSCFGPCYHGPMPP